MAWQQRSQRRRQMYSMLWQLQDRIRMALKVKLLALFRKELKSS